jgi:16S rRNA processing protein RimM
MSERQPTRKASPKDMTGSPQPGEPVFLVVGKLRRAHGYHGELLMEVTTDFPERLKPGKEVFLGDQHVPAKFKSVRPQGDHLLVTFRGIEDEKQAGELRNVQVFVRVDALPELPEGIYYHHQLIGMTVADESGKIFGKLDEVLQTGSNDVYVVRDADGKEVLFPALEEVIISVDLEQRLMVVRPQEWA